MPAKQLVFRPEARENIRRGVGAGRGGAGEPMATQAALEDVRIGPMALPGELVLVPHMTGLVLFAHGGGSSRHSGRNRQVAQVLQQHHLGTLLFDLLTDAEAADERNRFDIDLLGARVVQALEWVGQSIRQSEQHCGLFGASAGAAAALVAAAARPAQVAAVVSRGGRPDLAAPHLGGVQAPTLLLVGSEDKKVLELNRVALRDLRCDKRLEVVPGASHLFEEPGTLTSVAEMAAQWLENHLAHRSMA